MHTMESPVLWSSLRLSVGRLLVAAVEMLCTLIGVFSPDLVPSLLMVMGVKKCTPWLVDSCSTANGKS